MRARILAAALLLVWSTPAAYAAAVLFNQNSVVPIITIAPLPPSIPDTMPYGATVATYSVTTNNHSAFNGQIGFSSGGNPNNIFALVGSNTSGSIIVNPSGPGIGPNSATLVDNISLSAVTPGSAEEFVGPFASWNCARSSASGTCGAAGTGSGSAYFNATGDGSSDDTAAIQSCINALSSTHPVCYFPDGTYNITNTLVMPGNGQTCTTSLSSGLQYVSLIGQDPSATIRWTGAANGTMLCLNGVSFSKIDRLTFDANIYLSAKFILYQAWQGGQYSDSGNEYADDIFKNAGASSGIGFAYWCGGLQCSETTLLRDTFLNNVVAVQTAGTNSVDIWCWWCTFQGNKFGMSASGTPHSVPGAPCGTGDCTGNFSAFKSVFENTVNYDLTWGNNGPSFNLIDNYSSRAQQFINAGNTGAFDQTVLKGNTIINTGSCTSIATNDPGPVLALANLVITSASCTTLSSSTPTAGPSIVLTSGDALAKDNTFTKSGNSGNNCVSSGGSSTAPLYAGGRCHEYNETVQATAPPSPPALPGTPQKVLRKVFETAPSGSGTACSAGSPCSVQTAICLAATGNSAFSAGNCTGTAQLNRNVVHLPAGSYSACAVVPANSDIQIVGDGYYTIDTCGNSSTPSVKLNGWSRVVLRDLQLGGNVTNSIDGIEATGVDQAGATFLADQLIETSTTNTRHLFSDSGLSNVKVELHSCELLTTTDAGIVVAGGNTVNVYACLTNTGQPNGEYELTGAGGLLADATWNTFGNRIANLSGAGTFSLVGSHVGTGTSVATGFTATSFGGTAFLGGLDFTPVGFSGSPAVNVGLSSGSALGWGLTDNFSPYWLVTGSGTNELLNSFVYHGSGYGVNTIAETALNQSFVNTAMNKFETTSPLQPTPSTASVTAVELHRVMIGAARYGVWVH